MAILRETSRKDWESGSTLEAINAGSLQRIADAVEKMASSYDNMRRDRDYWEKRAKSGDADNMRLIHSNAALRGYIKSRKRKP